MKKELPPLKKAYKLNDEEAKIVARFKEELTHRLKTDVIIDIYTENYLAHPIPSLDLIKFEIQAGNWRRIMTISETELRISNNMAFFYFMRRLVDETMQDLLMRGANTY